MPGIRHDWGINGWAGAAHVQIHTRRDPRTGRIPGIGGRHHAKGRRTDPPHADKYVCVATCNVNELVDYLLSDECSVDKI